MIPCSNDAWDNPRTITLLHEMRRFDDIKPCWMQGAGKEQPWIMPIYGPSAEVEVADLLYALVRLLKPSYIVELGCHVGIGTYALARACQDNDYGMVHTCDIDSDCVIKTGERLGDLIPNYAEVFLVESKRMSHMIKQADFLWLDCDYEGRMDALGHMKVGAVAVMHDTRQEPILGKFIENLPAGYDYVQFSETHRGLSVIKRTV